MIEFCLIRKEPVKAPFLIFSGRIPDAIVELLQKYKIKKQIYIQKFKLGIYKWDDM